MGLELELTNQYDDVYPDAYKRLSYFGIDADKKTIVIVFNCYKSQAFRDANPARFFKQETYRILPAAQPEVRDAGGNVTQAAVPAFDTFVSNDMKNPSGTFATIYGFVKAQPDNAGAKDVL